MYRRIKPAGPTVSGRNGLAACALASLVVLSGSVGAQTPSAASPSYPGAAGQGQGQPSDEQAYAMIDGLAPPLPASAPKPSADPHNFEGTYFHDEPLIFRNTRDAYGKKIPFTPIGQAIIDRRVKATYVDGTPYANASAACVPPGQQWQLDLNMPFQIYQTRNEIDFLFEEYHGVWKIRLNQPHQTTGPRAYMGDSVGHWDGSTLVVETTGYKIPLWLDVDGTPASTNARIVRRIRKIDYGVPKLEIETTIYDPTLYKTPWTNIRTFAWRPDMASFNEYNCEYQLGAPGGVERYGLIKEPPEDYGIDSTPPK